MQNKNEEITKRILDKIKENINEVYSSESDEEFYEACENTKKNQDALFSIPDNFEFDENYENEKYFENMIEMPEQEELEEKKEPVEENFTENVFDNKEKVENIEQPKKKLNKKILFAILAVVLSVVAISGISKMLKSNKAKESIELAKQDDLRVSEVKDIDEDKPFELESNTNESEINNENADNKDATQTNVDTTIESLPENTTVSNNNYSSDANEIDEAINSVNGYGTVKDVTAPLHFVKREQVKSDNTSDSKSTEEVLNKLNKNRLKDNESAYEVKQGSVIPAILLTEINTDLPGTILGQVRENVYDSVTGKHLLIPKGSKLYGKYDYQIAAGQNRVLIVWDKLILTNGKHLDLLSMQGADNLGNSGLKDKTNNHTLALLGKALLSSAINVTNTLAKSVSFNIKGIEFGLDGNAKGENSKENKSPMEEVAAGILKQGADRKPTITIRRGFKFNIIVNEDLVLEKYKK